MKDCGGRSYRVQSSKQHLPTNDCKITVCERLQWLALQGAVQQTTPTYLRLQIGQSRHRLAGMIMG